jgi:hypothetical protein
MTTINTSITEELDAALAEAREKHQPEGEGSWLKCRGCAQTVVLVSEERFVWPCDTRRLADLVVEELS